MKALYEASNGYTAESYVRCYVWADDEAEALRLATEAFQRDRADPMSADYPDEYVSNVRVALLFRSDAGTFCTQVSGDGWQRA